QGCYQSPREADSLGFAAQSVRVSSEKLTENASRPACQLDAKTGVSVLARPANPSAMSFCHLASNGETEPDALRLGGDKRLEQPRRQLRGRPRPRVGHFNDDCGCPIFQSALYLDPSPRPGSLHGIAEHVEKQLLQLTEIARERQFFRRRLPAQLNAS